MHVEYLFLWRADTSIRSLPSYFLGVCDPFDYGCWMVKAGFSELLLLLLLLLQLLMILGARVLNVETFDAFLNLHFIVLLTTSHHTHTHTHTHTHRRRLCCRQAYPQSTFRIMKVMNKEKKSTVTSTFLLFKPNPETFCSNTCLFREPVAVCGAMWNTMRRSSNYVSHVNFTVCIS